MNWFFQNVGTSGEAAQACVCAVNRVGKSRPDRRSSRPVQWKPVPEIKVQSTQDLQPTTGDHHLVVDPSWPRVICMTWLSRMALG